MNPPALTAMLASAGIMLASSASAYEMRAAWVFRLSNGVEGPLYPPIPPASFDASSLPAGTAIRFRLRLGLFDDDAGPPPAGGLFGWTDGTLTATGGVNTRTGSGSTPADPRGRLTPFNSAPDPPAEGLPQEDPWTTLTSIDNTLGAHTLPWTGEEGTPNPGSPPPAIVRGRNSSVSTWELTTVIGTTSYTITAAGILRGVAAWSVVEETPPDPGRDGIFGVQGDPADLDDIDGSIHYAPIPDLPHSFSSTLNIIVPAPAAAAPLLFTVTLALARRRR